jgi:hypothetical protein
MITYKFINMDATLIANTYLFATRKINKWELSCDMSLSKLRADSTLVANHPNTCMWLQWTEHIAIPVIAVSLAVISNNPNKLIPFV